MTKSFWSKCHIFFNVFEGFAYIVLSPRSKLSVGVSRICDGGDDALLLNMEMKGCVWEWHGEGGRVRRLVCLCGCVCVCQCVAVCAWVVVTGGWLPVGPASQCN